MSTINEFLAMFLNGQLLEIELTDKSVMDKQCEIRFALNQDGLIPLTNRDHALIVFSFPDNSVVLLTINTSKINEYYILEIHSANTPSKAYNSLEWKNRPPYKIKLINN